MFFFAQLYKGFPPEKELLAEKLQQHLRAAFFTQENNLEEGDSLYVLVQAKISSINIGNPYVLKLHGIETHAIKTNRF